MPWRRDQAGCWILGPLPTSRHLEVGRWKEEEELNPLGTGDGKQSPGSLELRQTTLGRCSSDLKLSGDAE